MFINIFNSNGILTINLRFRGDKYKFFKIFYLSVEFLNFREGIC